MNRQNQFDFQKKVEQLRGFFDFDFVGVALVQSAEHRFELRWEYVTGNQSNRYRRIVLQTGKGVAGHVFKTGKPFLVEDVEGMLGKNDLFNYPIVEAEGLKCFGAVPLYRDSRVKGVLLVGYRVENRLSSEKFVEFQQVIGSELGPFYNEETIKN